MPTVRPARRALRQFPLFSVLLFGVGCSEAATEPKVPVVSSILVTSAVISSDAIGDTIRLRAEVLDEDGVVIPGVAVTWSSSNTGAVAVAADGLATTTGNGAATIRAAVGSVVRDVGLTVQQRAASIQFSADSVVLSRWLDTASVTVTATDRLGTPVPLQLLQLTSADSQVVRVSASGLLTSGRAGSVRVIAAGEQANAARDTLVVRVAVQRNPACVVPAAPAARGAPAAALSWISSAIPNSAVPMADSTMVGPIAAPVAMDVDDDGRRDVVVPWYIIDRPATRRTIVGMRTFRNTGSGLLESTSTMWGGATASWVFPRIPLVLNADGDGRDDLLLLDTGYDPAGYPGAGCDGAGMCPGARNTLLRSTGASLVDATARLTTNSVNGFSHAGDVADIDCDGDDDILEGTWSSGDAPEPGHLHINNGSAFIIDDARLPASPSRTLAWVGATMCDLDRDGDPDAIVSTFGRRVDILVNNGFGHFRRMPTSTVPEAPGGDAATEYAEMRCADFDGDGWNDIVLARHAQVVGGTSVTLLRNNQDMSFRDASSDAPTTIALDATHSWVWSMFVEDMNADSWPDIVMLSTNARARILYGSGSGQFTEYVFPATDWWIGAGNKVVVGDYNGDGKGDLYVYRGRFDHFIMIGQ